MYVWFGNRVISRLYNFLKLRLGIAFPGVAQIYLFSDKRCILRKLFVVGR